MFVRSKGLIMNKRVKTIKLKYDKGRGNFGWSDEIDVKVHCCS